jgi:hypothetical protein
MWRHPVLKVLLSLYVVWSAWNWFTHRPMRAPDGVLAAEDPHQTDVPNGATLQNGRWRLTIRAHYSITARILGRENYRFDALSGLIPEDLALGWGPMSDNRVLNAIDISQSNRFYYWHADRMPIARELIVSHSANTHVIPRDALIARELARLRPGQVATLSGELVDAVRDDGLRINTSLTRTDSGPGACEVLWVDDVAL